MLTLVIMLSAVNLLHFIKAIHIRSDNHNNNGQRFVVTLFTLYINGHKFSWSSQFSFCGIELLTEDGTVVFSQPLSSMESSVTIPETLSGTFTIVMYLGEMVYMGEVTI